MLVRFVNWWAMTGTPPLLDRLFEFSSPGKMSVEVGGLLCGRAGTASPIAHSEDAQTQVNCSFSLCTCTIHWHAPAHRTYFNWAAFHCLSKFHLAAKGQVRYLCHLENLICQDDSRSSLWLSGLKIWWCHYSGTDSIPGSGASACFRCSKKRRWLF